MELKFINIALVSDNEERINLIKLYLHDIHTTVTDYKFKKFYPALINLTSLDLIIFDCVSLQKSDFTEIYNFRSETSHFKTPFLFLIKDEQKRQRSEILKLERTGFLKDTFDEYDFLSQVRNLVSIAQLEKHAFFQDDALEGEKKLIPHLDKIMQIPSLGETKSMEEFFLVLQVQFVRRMELTFAAEKVLFFEYDEKLEALVLKIYEDDRITLKNKQIFNIKSSVIKRTYIENKPLIFEKQQLLDPFIQELEEALDFEIRSVLFAPFTILHQPKGGFAIINKIHHKSFKENDIALSMITIYKLIFQFEQVYLKKFAVKNFDTLLSKKSSDEFHQDFQYILDEIEFGVIVFNKNFHISFINKCAKKTLGMDRNQHTFSLLDAFGENAVKDIKEMVNKKPFPLLGQEIRVNRLGKRSLYLGYSIYTVRKMKTDIQYVCTFMEISHTKRLQAEIIRMDRMASLGVLASGIAHEIRNPLAGIKAMAQTLEEELEEDTEKVEYVQRIVRQVNRLDELLKSFFSYAKPQRPNPEPCNIPDIVKEVLPLFQRKIKDNNITIKEIYSGDLKRIFVDFHQIEQVFFNLFMNAIDAMNKGGILTIKAKLPEDTQPLIDRRQRIPKLFSDTYNEIMITDTGRGMDTNTLHNIYNPFYTTKPNGTGLGLSIVYQIILEHGGQITVDSEVGKGTTFRILLPVYVEKAQKESA